MSMERQWWTVEQIAALVEVNPETVRRWLRAGTLKGTLPADRLGYRVARGDLGAFVQWRYGESLEELSSQPQASAPILPDRPGR